LHQKDPRLGDASALLRVNFDQPVLSELQGLAAGTFRGFAEANPPRMPSSGDFQSSIREARGPQHG